jgi:hypothetical protein
MLLGRSDRAVSESVFDEIANGGERHQVSTMFPDYRFRRINHLFAGDAVAEAN